MHIEKVKSTATGTVWGEMAQCSATTKRGTRCKAKPLHDRDVCLAHADADTRASARFTPESGRLGGRPRKPRAIEILRERVERDVDRYLQPLEDGLTADRGLVVGDGEHARVEYVTDHGTRLKAAREVLDRVYGRPTQTHDVTTREEVSEIDREIQTMLAEMDRRDPRRQDVAKANGRRNGKAHA